MDLSINLSQKCTISTKLAQQANENFRTLQFTTKNNKQLLKVFLLSCIHKVLCKSFLDQIQFRQNLIMMEYYTVDAKVIQMIIKSIVETEEYTLEGIAYYTRIPFDVIFDAACGKHNQFSVTVWARVVDLYMQLKPEIRKILVDKLLEIQDRHPTALSL